MQESDESIHQRISRLKLILIWEGRLNRGRLMSLFGLGSNSASLWIREFREHHPDWIVWDSKTRSFHATHEAYRNWRGTRTLRDAEANALAQYLALVGPPHVAAQTDSAQGGILAAFPELSTPSPKHFATISEAIRLGRKVQLVYRSMQHPEPHQRIISPHSLIRAGRRWHVRGYCDTHGDFRDYAFGRIVDVGMHVDAAQHTAANDKAWMTLVPVRLIAHPGLNANQESVIRFEYFNDTAARVETCRGALVSYFIQDVRAAVDVQKQLPPDYQIAVNNIDEVRPWLFPA